MVMEFVSRTFRITPREDNNTQIYSGWYVSQTPVYGYEHQADIATLPQEYFGRGVVAFTDAISRISLPMPEHMPYENGIHSGPAVRDHEYMHILIQNAGGIHDERGINDFVAHRLGYTVFPFPSY